MTALTLRVMRRPALMDRMKLLLAAVGGLALLAVACGGTDTDAPADGPSTQLEAPPVADLAGVALAIPTGEAVTVPPGYEPPLDHIDSTGAHLPVNGKPTLVFVDAIW